MTSRRRLKKEIDYVVSDLVLDCYSYMSLYEKPNEEKALQIVQDTLALRNELRVKINHPEKKDGSRTVKNHYDNIAKSLIDSVEESYGKLAGIANSESQL